MDPRKIYPILFLLLLVPLSSARFSPADNILLDCGSNSPSTSLSDHRIFRPDSQINSDGVSLRSPNPNSLYQTARVFTTPSSYKFQIKNKGTHLLRLHFYPFSSLSSNLNLSSAHFHVFADNDFVLLSNFAFDWSSTPSPLLKEYLLHAESDSLILSFVPAAPSAFAVVSAIELFSAPRDLLPDRARLVGPTLKENFDRLSHQALETLYRINVAGPKVTPFNDTLWRTWLPDSGFSISGPESRTVTFSGRIVYRKYGASREVGPDNVYGSARVSRASNMTWVFPVDSGYKYLVRMHFCDIASLALNELYLNVYVNGYAAYQDLDLSDATGQVLASPYYLDLVAGVDSTGLLTVVVGPSSLSDPSKVGGLLNGLEIMKINNTIGSLAGGVPSLLAMQSSRTGGSVGEGGGGGAMARSLICGFVFVVLLGTAFMLMSRWKAETGKDGGLAWSPLPVDVSDGRFGQGSVALAGKFMYF
ncbi:putative receptor-like protein kinase [Iris pallida]|uniref:Receptor-like protein kinase n=1 Tax=Iris pallida TaxID=29817 RepID=A0AAX6I3E1_IRIPA|nr:putative receptor-like protein kinase [Iris pallida]